MNAPARPPALTVPIPPGLRLVLVAVAVMLGILSAPEVAALATDREQPISIEADWAEADDARRITVYKGKVVVIQGSIHITGDVVTMYYDTERSLTRLVATGRPARFRQEADGGGMQRANASHLEYLVSTDTMVLVGGAQLAQGSNKVSADRIEYDTRRSRLKAEAKPRSDPDGKATGTPGKGRVRIVIEPKSKQ